MYRTHKIRRLIPFHLKIGVDKTSTVCVCGGVVYMEVCGVCGGVVCVGRVVCVEGGIVKVVSVWRVMCVDICACLFPLMCTCVCVACVCVMRAFVCLEGWCMWRGVVCRGGVCVGAVCVWRGGTSMCAFPLPLPSTTAPGGSQRLLVLCVPEASGLVPG